MQLIAGSRAPESSAKPASLTASSRASRSARRRGSSGAAALAPRGAGVKMGSATVPAIEATIAAASGYGSAGSSTSS